MNSSLRPLVMLAMGLLLLAACQPTASGSPFESGDDLTGDIQVSGSSTVKPITSFVAEAAHQSFVQAGNLGLGERFIASLLEAQEQLNGVKIVPR